MNDLKLQENYIDGNTVRKMQPAPSRYEENMFIKNRQVVQAKKKRLRKQKVQSFKYYLFVTMIFTGLIVLSVRYLYLYNDYTMYKNQVVEKEQYLQVLIDENTATATKLYKPLDLLEIKRIATEEYGMVEASSDQIKFYIDSNESYVKQYSDVPEDESTAINVVGFITFGR